MKLPWDKNYLKISFHVIFTLFAVCILAITFYNIVPILKFCISIFATVFSILSPLWIGITVAYLLDPLADYFQNKYLNMLDKNQLKIDRFKKKLGLKTNYAKIDRPYRPRAMGASLSYISILISIVFIVFFASSSIGNSGGSTTVNEMANQIYTSLNSFTEFLSDLQLKVGQWGIAEQLNQIINITISKITSFTKELGNQILSGISKTGEIVVNIAVGVVIGFYFIKDKDMAISKLRELSNLFIPKKLNSFFRIIIGDIDAVFSGYIRGQITDATIMAVLIAISLSAINIDFSVLIGIISGFSNIIPYVGAFVGAALAVLVGLLSGTPLKAIIALILIVILQQLDGIFISPKVLSSQVDLHPVIVILALSIGGTMFGLWGMVFAVPVAAIFKIFLERYTKRRKLAKQKPISR